jgi:hypothetical protein
VKPWLDLQALAVALAPLLRPLLVAESAVYTSTTLPPGVNARTFARWCRTRVEGAMPDGKGWRCTAAAWGKARAAAKVRLAHVVVPGSDEDEVEAMVAASGRSRLQ